MAYVVMTARPRVQRSPRAAAEHASAPKRMHRRARACVRVRASYVRGRATRACHGTIEHCSSAGATPATAAISAFREVSLVAV